MKISRLCLLIRLLLTLVFVELGRIEFLESMDFTADRTAMSIRCTSLGWLNHFQQTIEMRIGHLGGIFSLVARV